MNHLRNFLFQPVDNSQLVLFRMIFGFILVCEAWGAILTGWVRRAFIEPKMNFPFFDFDFLHPLPGDGMIYYFLLMGVIGIMVMLGFKYRLAMVGYAFMWSGVYFMQKTSYNNHYYLMVLLTWLFCLLPAHRAKSLDSKLNPELLQNHCFQWHLWSVKGLVLIVYFYSSVAKMYPDWIEGLPIRIWFTQKSDYWLVGPLLAKAWFQGFVAWGGIIFDLLIGPALLWKKTRKYAFFGSVLFHGFNSAVFQVGIFPFMGIAFGLFYFEPEVIRKLFFGNKPFFNREIQVNRPTFQMPKTIAFVVFMVVMFLLPMRNRYFDGNVTWTEEGHRLSWRMMLRSKSGEVQLYLKKQNGEKRFVNLKDYLTGKQQRSIATRPDMLWYFVQHLKNDLAIKDEEYVGIYAKSWVSLNGKVSKPLYDETVDLSKVTWNKYSENLWVTRSEDLAIK
ncbi:MAG: HTTM domain-containing protein [Vicingaceae bacterium]